MTTRTRSIVAWTPAILVSLFLIVASAAPKLFLSYEGSSLQEFATQLGVWDILFYVGLLELACAVLFLIPRTATVGFILMVGLLGGALATGLTHPEAPTMPSFPIILLALITLSAYYRCPELLSRFFKRPVPSVPRAVNIGGWVLAIFFALMFLFSAITKFMPVEPGSAQAVMTERLGFTDISIGLGILQLIIIALFIVPRTSTIGFVLVIGYMGGILATNLSHDIPSEEVMMLAIPFVLLTLSAFGRHPELISRLRGKPVPAAV